MARPRVDVQAATEGGQPVSNSLQASAFRSLRSVEPGPVVGDGELEMLAGAGQVHGPVRRVRVLCDVLHGLEGAEVHSGLSVLRVAPDAVRLDRDRQRSVADLGSQGGDETLVSEEWRGYAAGQFP